MVGQGPVLCLQQVWDGWAVFVFSNFFYDLSCLSYLSLIVALSHIFGKWLNMTAILFTGLWNLRSNKWTGPCQTNLVLIACASSEGSGEPAHPRSLARTSAARSYKQWVKRNLKTESQIPSEISDQTNRLGNVKRIWYLSPMRAAKVQASLRIRAVSPEPPLLAHTSSESRGPLRQKARSLAPLNGWACAVKICHDRMLEDTNLLDGAQTVIFLLSWQYLPPPPSQLQNPLPQAEKPQFKHIVFYYYSFSMIKCVS